MFLNFIYTWFAGGKNGRRCMDAGYVLTKNGEEVPLPAQKKEEDADVKEAPKRRPRK